MLSRRIRFAALCALVIIVMAFAMPAGAQSRREIKIPDVPGYRVLKFDLHMHTVFSDGKVWPTIRVQEAWREGLDGISITDHIEYVPFKKDIPVNYNRPYEIALPEAEKLGILLIRGAEITRNMPPGHINAIFLEDVDRLNTEKWEDAVKAAFDQKAFIFWNHPGWKGQQPDGIAKWYDEHTMMLEKGWMHGIEMVNEFEYYPEAHQWCLEKNRTMVGNSDVHDPIAMAYDPMKGERRPLTLVLAKEKTLESVREALFAGRTVVYWKNSLMGRAEHLSPIFNQSVAIEKTTVEIKPKGRAYFQIRNISEIEYELDLAGSVADFDAPKTLTIPAERTVVFYLRSLKEDAKGQVKPDLPYVVKNLKTAPDAGLPVTFPVTVNFIAAE